MNGARNGTFFGPAPWGPEEGPNGQISINIIKFQSQSLFQRFLNQTLCVFSQMKDIRHIRRDFYYAPVMGLGGTVRDWGVNFFPRNSTRFGVGVTYMNGTCTGTMFWVPAPWGLVRGPKCKISLNLNYKVNFKDILNQPLCIFSQIKDIFHIRQDFHSVTWVIARGGTWVYRGVGGHFFFEIQPDLVCELLT